MNPTEKRYLDWLIQQIDPVGKQWGLYSCLLTKLYFTEFIYTINLDANRLEDGLELRLYFEYDTGLKVPETIPCTVLEVMVALSKRCENQIMDNPDIGDRSPIWFWSMVENLGLMNYTNVNYDEREVESIIFDFLMRRYKKNGYGSLFCVKRKDVDMRNVEIWNQMNYWLEENYIFTL